jgi:hypothetical protein
MYPSFRLVLLPVLFVALRITLNVPTVLYVITGFCSVYVEGLPPWNVHRQAVGLGLTKIQVRFCRSGRILMPRFEMGGCLFTSNGTISKIETKGIAFMDSL